MTKNQSVALANEASLLAPAASSPPAGLYARMLDSTPFLGKEDRNLYRQTFDTLASEIETKSFLEWMQIKDYSDQVLWENRYHTMIVDVIETARKSPGINTKSDQRSEFVAAKDYVGLLEPLARLAENKAKARRIIQKELVNKPRKRIDVPPIVPEIERSSGSE